MFIQEGTSRLTWRNCKGLNLGLKWRLGKCVGSDFQGDTSRRSQCPEVAQIYWWHKQRCVDLEVLSMCLLVCLLHGQMTSCLQNLLWLDLCRKLCLTYTSRAALSITKIGSLKTATPNTLKSHQTCWEEQAKWDFTFSCRSTFGGCWSLMLFHNYLDVS